MCESLAKHSLPPPPPQRVGVGVLHSQLAVGKLNRFQGGGECGIYSISYTFVTLILLFTYFFHKALLQVQGIVLVVKLLQWRNGALEGFAFATLGISMCLQLLEVR